MLRWYRYILGLCDWILSPLLYLPWGTEISHAHTTDTLNKKHQISRQGLTPHEQEKTRNKKFKTERMDGWEERHVTK